MDIRYSCNQRDFKRYTTEEVRNEFLITDLYKADEMVAVYSHVDRMVTLGCMPVNEVVSIDKGIDIWANFGTHYFLERREIGIFNIGDGAGTITADGVTYPLESPFFVIATQNPVEMQGTFPLPEAQLDRFLLCLSLGYPDKEQELALLSRTAVPEEGKPVVTTAQLLNARKELAQVKVSAAVQEYLVELSHATRTHHQIQLGLSTRGMLSLLEVSKAVAAIRGRNYVTPDDIKHIAADCMAHRMAARGAMWEENHETCRRIVLELLETVPVPKESQWN